MRCHLCDLGHQKTNVPIHVEHLGFGETESNEENFLRRKEFRREKLVHHLRSVLDDAMAVAAADADWSFFDLYATSRFSRISSSDSHLESECYQI